MGPQVITDSGPWAGNGLRFATQEEAATYVAEFSLVRSTRVFESSDPVNYRWKSGRLETFAHIETYGPLWGRAKPGCLKRNPALSASRHLR